MQNGYWKTLYTEEGLFELCQFTPTIKNFDINKDRVNFKNAISKLKTTKGIEIQQNRILIIAIKN